MGSRSTSTLSGSVAVAIMFAAMAAMVALTGGATAGDHRILYSFCQTGGCPDGQTPFGGMATDGMGKFLGTTIYGGNSSDRGTIYELAKTKSGWSFRSLYSFCSETGCHDGGGSPGALIVDTSGNLYGTAESGGIDGGGVVFELTARGKYRVLYNFCSAQNCTDGSEPTAGLTYQGAQTGALYDGVSTLYGTTSGGGANDGGAVFALTPAGSETVVYSFNPATQDGTGPEAGLAIDRAGKLYGTTTQRGQFGSGTIFRVSVGGAETILHAFCARANCTDGGAPGYGELVMDSGGNLFGTSPNGGKYGDGLVYEIRSKTYKILYNFCKLNTCPTGTLPQGALTMDASGNLFGVTPLGGRKFNGGVVFELNSSLKVLYSFCNGTNCPDGGAPYSKVVLDKSGDIFGTTTQGGGAINGGTIFELTP
jgi:uncharacterized repeat protein (TIGR03803 family)